MYIIVVLLQGTVYSLLNIWICYFIAGDSVLYITRPNDKKKILFYNDKYCQFNVDEEFTKLWRGKDKVHFLSRFFICFHLLLFVHTLVGACTYSQVLM